MRSIASSLVVVGSCALLACSSTTPGNGRDVQTGIIPGEEFDADPNFDANLDFDARYDYDAQFDYDGGPGFDAGPSPFDAEEPPPEPPARDGGFLDIGPTVPPIARPNIIFILADDLGYGDIEPYGQRKIHTPNLLRMASQGTRFTTFYAGAPVCAPSRSTFLTGQHTGHTPVRGNLGDYPIPADSITIAEALHSVGYTTGITGKWGMGGPSTTGAPNRQGFDYFYGYSAHAAAHNYYPESLYRNATMVPQPGNRVDPRTGWPTVRAIYSHDAIVNQALGFIEANRTRPFFLWATFTLPHANLDVPNGSRQPYLDDNNRSIFPETPFPGNSYAPQSMPFATYAGMVSRLDRDVGRILDRLREWGLARNTIVFFSSDNGPHIQGGYDGNFFNSNGPFRGHKRDVYEGGIREPMIVWGPGHVPPGRVRGIPWAMWDVFPTVAALAGAPVPRGIDGVSMAGAITGSASPAHPPFYWEFYEDGTKQAFRDGRWKIVRMPGFTGPIQLFDLDNDPGEQMDVADRYPDRVLEMRRRMNAQHVDSPVNWTQGHE